MLTSKFLLVVIFATISVFSFSQTAFTGSWERKDIVTIKGTQWKHRLPSKLKVTIIADSLVLMTTTVYEDGKIYERRETYPLDGKTLSRTITPPMGPKWTTERSFSLSPDTRIITLTDIELKPGHENSIETMRVQTWSIENGQLVIRKKSTEVLSENWEVRGVFERN